MWEDLDVALTNFQPLLALAIFFAYLMLDALVARYTLAVTERKSLQAANISAATHFLLAFGVLSYVENVLYIFPIAVGSWVGTYLVVRYSWVRASLPD